MTDTRTGRPPPSEQTPDRSTPPVLAHPDRACRDVDVEVFFPAKGDPGKEARDICGRCPRRQPCLDWAIDTKQGHGIYGGKGPDERKAIGRLREMGLA